MVEPSAALRGSESIPRVAGAHTLYAGQPENWPPSRARVTMLAMKRLVIADSHLGQGPGDPAKMCALLDRAADAGVGEVIYLGDSFHYLIGMAKFWSPTVREVLAGWDRIRDRGLRVVLIEGNRDFFLDDEDLVGHIDASCVRYEFTAGDTTYRLIHGDKVNRDDLQYLFWAGVSKSRIARLFAHLLPRRIAIWIVNTMENRLARSNRKFRYRKPVDDLRHEAELAWSEGVRVMLWGHFHTHWDHVNGDSLTMVVPAWLESSLALLVEADGRWSMVDDHLRPCAIPRNTEHGEERETT